MALHESVLEEFGLAPLWVRRGMAAAPQAAAEAQAEGGAGADAGAAQGVGDTAGQGASRDDVRGAARGLPPAARSHSREAAPASALAEEETAPPAARSRESGSAAVRTQETAPAASRAGEARRADAAPAPSERRALPAQDAAQAAPGRAQTPAETRQPKQPQQPSRTPEPPAFDAPPEDDFAWFDDLPTHAPADAAPAAPPAPAVHTLDWDALSERVAACRLCRLCEKRTNTVFGVGDRGADWMLIGEAPGENEDRLGEPFVGQAGKLLDNMLRSLTLARDANVYIANVIKCRPPGNRNPEPDEVARCEPYLQRQVALVKPKLIVALGRFAAQSLLKTDASISSLRGRVHEYEGVPVIVTYHPAYLLRSLPDKAKAWADLCLARDTWRAAGGAPSNASNASK
ncbi:uracil-DNA glycosylase [Paraburkholderia xenovorans]|uniref:uracil-DNA glycosylase n=1 Tax=Paraburkholderia xenovorans TaxID=36873 RepID=UPI0015C559FA|nr:uracil-DNA glycosylase [Paraburkholderia xenovorans]NPT38384.1 uracil-DNA glycosylase [Paraburkholderia xenovorans]